MKKAFSIILLSVGLVGMVIGMTMMFCEGTGFQGFVAMCFSGILMIISACLSGDTPEVY